MKGERNNEERQEGEIVLQMLTSATLHTSLQNNGLPRFHKFLPMTEGKQFGHHPTPSHT